MAAELIRLDPHYFSRFVVLKSGPTITTSTHGSLQASGCAGTKYIAPHLCKVKYISPFPNGFYQIRLSLFCPEEEVVGFTGLVHRHLDARSNN